VTRAGDFPLKLPHPVQDREHPPLEGVPVVEGGGYLRTLASAQAIPNGGGVFAVEALELITGALKTLRDRGFSVALW